jgi:pimeloyl-ACP methyl ester carboxylesterase
VPTIQANGVELFYEVTGSGDPMVLVHGSWVDQNSWATVVPGLAESFQVLTYDRRGHSNSERPDSQGSVHEDADDLAALLEAVDLPGAHVITNSYGGNIAMRLAVKRPQLVRSLAMHEPPIFALLAGDPESAPMLEQTQSSFESVGARIAEGDHEGAARQFVEEVAFGPGAWENELSPEIREVFVRNAPTCLDELRDPDALGADLDGLSRFQRPVLLTDGSESPPMFPKVIDVLARTFPNARRNTYAGAAHMSHLTHPEEFTSTVSEFAGGA